MYSFGQNLTPDESDELKHAELLDALGALGCEGHGEHGHWRFVALAKIHERVYGNRAHCKYCCDNTLAGLDANYNTKIPEPVIRDDQPGFTNLIDLPASDFDSLPEAAQKQLLRMGIKPEQVHVNNGVIVISVVSAQ
jgi:hypothetical protein